MSANDLRSLLMLRLIPGLGPRRIHQLLEHFGSAERVLQASRDQLAEVPHISYKFAQEMVARARTVGAEADKELQRVERAGVRLLPLGDPLYPASLAGIPDPPPLLYYRGELHETDARAVAMVGSRTFTEYGKKMAHAVATGLARAGVTVVSGLARGIDGIAHQAALEAGGRTLAVMANGLGRVYPPEHTDLALRIASAGAVMSENRMDEEPSRTLFPGRNRIISGLSQIVVIIEAAARSGSLITAEHAAEQGRTVMAIPGPAGSNTSEGTNALIRQGAILCRGVDDVLEELMGVSAFMQHQAQTPASPPPAPPPPPSLDPTQQRIWDFLRDGARSLDQLVQQLGLPVPQLSATLMMLEMKKVVRRLPGNRYERV